MKKVLITLLSASLFFAACKPKTADTATGTSIDSTATQTTTSTTVAATPASQPANTPKTYTVAFAPDSAILGKQKQVLLKIKAVSATELSDPDGKAQGIELSFKMSVTNKTKIGGDAFSISSGDFRIVLDNNTSISQASGTSMNVQPESTNESDVITYRLPAGSKPKMLNLYYDETRASVGVSLK